MALSKYIYTPVDIIWTDNDICRLTFRERIHIFDEYIIFRLLQKIFFYTKRFHNRLEIR